MALMSVPLERRPGLLDRLRTDGLFRLFECDASALHLFAAAGLVSSVAPFTDAVRTRVESSGVEFVAFCQTLEQLRERWYLPWLWTDDLNTRIAV